MADPMPWDALYPARPAEPRATAASMLALVRGAIDRDPAAPALIYFDAVIDHARLDDLSERMARHWHDVGVVPGDRIAVILQNVPQCAIAVIAAWKLGAVPVPMNPMYRSAELARLFADCTPRAIICHDDHIAEVAPAAASIAPNWLLTASLLTTSAHEFQTRSDPRVLPPRRPADGRDMMDALASVGTAPLPMITPAPDDLALLLYTSGTTGVPKGAMLTHRSLVSNADFTRDWMLLRPHSVIFGIAPLFHITGFVCQMCAGFAAACPTVLTYRFAPDVALDAMREHRPSFMIGAITAYIALMQAPEVTADDFASFEHLFSGGAPIPPSTVTRFAARFGKAIRTAYGMTETAAPALFSPPEGEIPVDKESGALSIGVPIPGMAVEIVDEQRRPLGVGEIGELRMRGPQIMTGYWQKPEETAEALADGWMHSGDIGFRDAAGWHYLIDRKKDVIIASGFKVWPREVEDVLYAHPAVREAAVVGEPDAYRGETVLAFVSFNAGATASPEELKAWCRTRLAAYKAPHRFSIMSDLPKTGSGKIMRSELRPRPLATEPQ